VEDSKPASPRNRQVGRLDLTQHRGLAAGAKQGDRLHPAPIFVAKREAVQQILDGDQTCAFEVGRLSRPDAFQELERSI